MSSLFTPNRRSFLHLAAVGAAGLAMPAVVTRRSLAAASQIVVADYGGGSSDAMKKAFSEPFEKETGIKVVHVAHETDPVTQFKLLVDTKSYIWDVCSMDTSHVLKLTAGKNYLAPVGVKDENGEIIKDMVTENWLGYSVFADAMAYRSDVFGDKGPTTWADFWNLEKFPGRRGLSRDAIGVFEHALIADGVAPKDLYPIDVDRALVSLDKIKKSVSVWWGNGAQNAQILQNGEVDMSNAWSSRAAAVKESGAPINIVWTGSYAVDGLGIPNGSPRLEEARAYVQFYTRADRQAEYSSLVANGPTNRKALQLLKPERAAVLPTSAENLAGLVATDNSWWADNFEAADKRFKEWQLA
ncbi:ABC transporter substrate-binding protein [Mesorhizobium sp. INR15]|uniref:ABC transporter substrate-binding protein n=1 Tax=Mesorhizobium sp. INR15 TaxID=2654248 RepID=UPI0018969630|nr:ABC transporter substrate-binding protein [Mesorhizobium sp. INR15]QPC94495.1 extracellular solute-binding protein [Mesorhizobium sp. INR15]